MKENFQYEKYEIYSVAALLYNDYCQMFLPSRIMLTATDLLFFDVTKPIIIENGTYFYKPRYILPLEGKVILIDQKIKGYKYDGYHKVIIFDDQRLTSILCYYTPEQIGEYKTLYRYLKSKGVSIEIKKVKTTDLL